MAGTMNDNALVSSPDVSGGTQDFNALMAGRSDMQQAIARKQKMYDLGKQLYSRVTDQGTLDLANRQFTNMTGIQAPYQGQQYSPGFRDRALYQISEAEGMLAAKAKNMGDPYKDIDVRNKLDQINERQEKRSADAEKRAKGIGEAESKAKIINSKVDEALGNVGWNTAGLGSLLANIPGTAARDLQGTIDTIKANMGFEELRKMREASPKGGALGQVAVKELEFLQAALTSLDTGQSTDRLRENLNQVKQHYQNWLDTMQKAGSYDRGRNVQTGIPRATNARPSLDSFQR